MIELLGIGVPGRNGQWLFRAVSGHAETGEITFVVSSDRAARIAVIETLRAERIPRKGGRG
jgi:hypothetical protein